MTHPQTLTKTLRIRKCGTKLRIPVGTKELVFICQLEKPFIETPHKHYERGYIEMPNGTVRAYEIYWIDEGVATIRQGRRR